MNSQAQPIEIALIEDDGILREELSQFLGTNNYKVYQANSGLAFDDLLIKRNIDLIILDLNLPGQNGFEIAKKLRASRPQIGIIMLTARTALTDRIKSYESGADIYLPKPTPPQEILAAVNSLAKRVGSSKPKSWTLHISSSQLLSPNGESTVELIPIETYLLSALAQAENNTLESESICEILSEQLSMEIMTKRALENVISRFRKKLLPLVGEESHRSIQSIRSSGYRLCFPITIIHS